MGQESLVMKAWRDFAMADPEDCDREWDTYLALANRKETASGSSPTISTSPLHHRAPAAVVTALSTTRSTASPSVLSSAAPTDEFNFKPYITVDDPSPEARRLYGLLIGDSAARASTASLHAPSSSVKDGLTPEARRIYDYLIGDSVATAPAASEVSAVLPEPTALNVTPITVDINATELAARMSTNCSSKCQSQDAAVPVSVLISSTAPTSSMTIGDVLSDLDASVEGDKALDVNDMGEIAPTAAIYLLGGQDYGTGGEDPMAMSLIPRSVPAPFNMPPEDLQSPLQKLFWLPTACSVECSGHSTETPSRPRPEPYKVFSVVPTVPAIAPWPPPSFTHAGTSLIHGQDLFYNAQQKRGNEFLVAWEMESPVPQPMQDSMYNQGKQSAILLELREDSYQFEGTEVMILQQPWLSPLALCMNLPTSNLVLGCHLPTFIVVGLQPVCLQLGQLTIAQFAAMLYMIAHTITLHHHFSSGNLILLSIAATNSAMVPYMHCKGPPDPDESDCLASRYFVVLYATRLEGQPSVCVAMLQTHKIYSTRLSSWKDVMLVVDQWKLMRCTIYVFNSVVMQLVLDGDDSSYLASQFIQRDYEIMQ